MDMFYASGFLFGLCRNKSLEECGQMASIASAEIISHYGHDSGEFKYFGALGGNDFVDLDLRDDLLKTKLDRRIINAKLSKLFNSYNL